MKQHPFKAICAIFALTLAVAAAFSGCSTIIPIQTSDREVVYVRGSLATTLTSPIDKVQKAVTQAIKTDLRFTILSTAEDAICAQYEARTALDEKVLIRLKRNTETSTVIDIRVSLIGNKDVSYQILDAVNARLR